MNETPITSKTITHVFNFGSGSGNGSNDPSQQQQLQLKQFLEQQQEVNIKAQYKLQSSTQIYPCIWSGKTNSTNARILFRSNRQFTLIYNFNNVYSIYISGRTIRLRVTQKHVYQNHQFWLFFNMLFVDICVYQIYNYKKLQLHIFQDLVCQIRSQLIQQLLKKERWK
ncbi:Hypothetical_protein [Hexamita inflata]|uniref:Hypothetical_protein n=1 Tax=Hexamita inflata TaxID=28002 RepID=A0AA86NID3_9EUKA|nr:Hypothetical protein HINF_LOCUS7537 [Hexamita inflata]